MDSTKTENLTKALPLVQDADLIKVQTVSEKIVEQLTLLDDGVSTPKDLKLEAYEIVGAVGWRLLLRAPNKQLAAIRAFAYQGWLIDNRGLNVQESQAVVNNLPQLFTR